MKETWICPYEGCGKAVQQNSERLKECEVTLDFLFPPVEALIQPDDLQVNADSPSGQQTVQVTTLTGDTKSVPFSLEMTVAQFKNHVKDATGVPPEKQRLVYNGQELEVR